MAYKLTVSESADRDLDEILAYIAEKLANPKAAADFAYAFEQKYEELESHPFMFEMSRNERANIVSVIDRNSGVWQRAIDSLINDLGNIS